MKPVVFQAKSWIAHLLIVKMQHEAYQYVNDIYEHALTIPWNFVGYVIPKGKAIDIDDEAEVLAEAIYRNIHTKN